MPTTSDSDAMNAELEAEKPDSWPARIGVGGGIRILAGLLALVGFGLGAAIAWRSVSATTLLVVSAVLFGIAALGLDWHKIRGTYGGWTIEVLRRFEERLEEVTATASTTEDVPEVVREELEALRSEVKAITPPRRHRTQARSSSISYDAMFKDLFTKRVTHSFVGRDAVKLRLRIPASQDSRYRATVRTPSGAVFNSRAVTGSVSAVGARPFTITYPDEFEGAEPFIPGRYEVEWRSAPLVDPAEPVAPLVALAQASAPVARDSFTIPAIAPREHTPRASS